MTLWADMKTAIRAELEETMNTEHALWSDDSLLRWTNEAQFDFAKRTLCLEDEEYANSTAGTGAYILPSKTIDVVTVMYGEETNPLLRMTAPQFFMQQQAGDSGTPTMYCVHHGALWLYPVPDEAAEMRFFRYYAPADISTEMDEVGFDGEHDSAIRNWVKSQAFSQIGDFTTADRCFSLYDKEAEETAYEVKRAGSADESLMPQMRW